MATDDFREDISVAFRRFVLRNKGKRPSVLKGPYEDAMIWLVAAFDGCELQYKRMRAERNFHQRAFGNGANK
jgi:hypothetical protein